MALAFMLSTFLARAESAPGTTTTIPDTLQLASLQRAAVLADPRQDRRDLDERESTLRVDRISAHRLPDFTVLGEASTQSDVVDIPGANFPPPPKEHYNATLHGELLLWDGGRNGAEKEVERASLGVEQARLDTELFDVRWDVDAAFFQAFFLQERLKENSLMLEDLGARLEETRARVAAGTALAGDAALLEAEVLSVRQQERSLQASRRAALDILENLTHRSFGRDVVMAEPSLATRLESIVPALSSNVVDLPDTLQMHPRFAVFEQRENELDQRISQVRNGVMPVLSAFGDASYANPGQRLFDDSFKGEWRVGLQLSWKPWDWDDRSRRVDELRVQALKIEVERRTFEQALVRTLQPWLQGLQRLQDVLATDASIIALREAVVEQARVQYAERAIPASRYVEARTELSRARVNQTVHRAELSQTRAAILLSLGMEID